MDSKRMVLGTLMAALARNELRGVEVLTVKARPEDAADNMAFYGNVATVNTGRRAEKAAIRAAKQQRKRDRKAARLQQEKPHE